MSNVLVFGASSAIAEAVCNNFASDAANFYLVARNSEKLNSIKQNLLARGAGKIGVDAIDLNQTEKHESLIAAAQDFLGEIDCVIIAYGTLGDQKTAQESYQETYNQLNTNLLSAISILTIIGNVLEKKQSGTIVVISSVAGDRGRQSNYVYGTAKGALSIFCQGLRNRLAASGAHVLTVKPGFVDTPMTQDFKKGFLWADPADVGNSIYNGIKNKKNVLYVPWFWMGIMCIIKHIPEFIFKKLKL